MLPRVVGTATCSKCCAYHQGQGNVCNVQHPHIHFLWDFTAVKLLLPWFKWSKHYCSCLECRSSVPAFPLRILLLSNGFQLWLKWPWGAESLRVVDSSSSRSSDVDSNLLDEGGSASQAPRASVELAGYGSVVWPDSLSEWLVDGAGLQ